ncbi:MAG: hypothetical protein ACM3UL_04790 [Ignavibacteria bacterium]
MTNSVRRKRHNKATRILLMPILAIFFLVGWGLYSIGRKDMKQSKKLINKTTIKQNQELELIVIPKEEKTIMV